MASETLGEIVPPAPSPSPDINVPPDPPDPPQPPGDKDNNEKAPNAKATQAAERKAPTSWAQLFKAAKEPVTGSGGASAYGAILEKIYSSASSESVFDVKAVQESRAEWRFSLIGKFLGKPPPLPYLIAETARRWKPAGTLKVIDMAAGFFTFKFSFEDDMLKVMGDLGPSGVLC